MYESLSWKEIIKNFMPSWFASIMGTGILAITSLFYSQYFSPLKGLAYALFYLNVILFFILLIPWTLRWILFKNQALEDLEHPINSNFYPTIAVAMLVLASDFIILENNYFVGEIFWFIGAFLTMFFGILTPYIMFRGEHVKLDHINPAWFIPPVGLIVIPIAGGLLLSHTTGIIHDIIALINYIAFGSGFFLYLALLAICVYRFILHHPLPNILAPTVWINLGPIGAGTVSLINLIKNSVFVTVKEPFFIFGIFFWGFGIWWTLMAIVMTIHYIKKLKLPFAMSWWAFTFPLGAYVASSHLVAQVFKFIIVDYIGFSLYCLLLFLWSATFVNTLIGVYKGTVFRR